jgi:hypothetical protein
MHDGLTVPDRAVLGRLNCWATRTHFDFKALVFISCLAIVEWHWIHWLGLRAEQGAEALQTVAAPLALGLLLHALGLTRRMATAATMLALWLAWMFAGAVLSYLAASFAMPLQDAALSALDARMGFDWLQWHRFVESIPPLDNLLRIAYFSMLPQVVLSIFPLSHADRREEREHFWWSTMTAMIITCAVSGLLPALCAWDYYRTSQHLNIHIPDLVALRDGTLGVVTITKLKGIVTFPSFHAAMAILLTYPYRSFRAFPLVVAWNILMLLSIPKHGGHYLVDILAGILVAAVSIQVVRSLRSRAMARKRPAPPWGSAVHPMQEG